MMWNIVMCLAIITLPLFDCKDTRNPVPTKIENPAKILTEKTTTPLQNVSTARQNNGKLTAQKKEMAVDKHTKTNKQPKRQVQLPGVPLTSVSAKANDLKAEQSFQSPLMVYPFSMLNSYYPRYFPYAYPSYAGYVPGYAPGYAGYHGFPFYG